MKNFAPSRPGLKDKLFLYGYMRRSHSLFWLLALIQVFFGAIEKNALNLLRSDVTSASEWVSPVLFVSHMVDCSK